MDTCILDITLQAPCRLGPPTEEVSIKMSPGPVANVDKEKGLDKTKHKETVKGHSCRGTWE